MYYTEIKHSSHLRTLEKCRKHSPAARVFYISLVFSNACRVLSQCNTRLRLLYLLNNLLHGFHSWEDTYLCYKKTTREYRLIRDFNFITRYEVSQSVSLRCTRTDTIVNNRNIFSNLASFVAQTLGVRAGILLGSRSCLKIRWRFLDAFYQGEKSIAPVDSYLLDITQHNMILDKFTQSVRS